MKRTANSPSVIPAERETAEQSCYKFLSDGFTCPVCFGLFEEPYMTKCGHTFCYVCLKKSLDQSNKCMKCNCILKYNEIYPNYALDNLIKTQIKKKVDWVASKRPKLEGSSLDWQSVLSAMNDDLHLSDIDNMLKMLQDKKKQMIQESNFATNKVLLEFLQELQKRKQLAEKNIKIELGVIAADINRVQEALASSVEDPTTISVVPNEDHAKREQLVPKPVKSKSSNQPSTSSKSSSSGLKIELNDVSTLYQTLSKRRCRLHVHFDELEDCYLNCRLNDAISPLPENDVEKLGDFGNKLQRFMQYSTIRPIASLNYVSDVLNQSSIVSSIDFDKDGDHFAVAGVTKKIKIYDYQSVISSTVDGNHCPLTQMSCNSKISCISWSHYHHNWLASSDYEGSVVIWDAFKAEKYRVFQEHEKRCWSVDFNSVDPRLLASGSDDAKVKIWSTETSRSVGVIEAKANVCCVQFNPHSAMHLVFGGADHFLHYYDIRNTSRPLSVFKGHKKAVSYTKFIDKDHIVSASTDSELRLWKTDESACVRTFRGHRNEKNFVGLAANGEYVACGSEDNSLYVYYKGFSKSLLTYKFNVVKSVLEPDKNDSEGKEFVSAVTWRANSNVIVAANSQGTIKVLELI